MKKTLKIFGKLLGGFILLIFILLLVVPLFFKEQIKEKVSDVANEKIEATFTFDDFSLSVIRNFPNLTFRLKGVSIVGINEFEGDTLASLRSFGLVFDISSIVKKSGYTVRSILIDRPMANAIVLENGKANWDIMKETVATPEEAAISEPEQTEEKKESDISLNLKKFEVHNGLVTYNDKTSGMSAGFDDLDLLLSGNMSEKYTDLVLGIDVKGVDFRMNGIQYVRKANLDSRFEIEADLENKIFRLGDNSLGINDLVMQFTGQVDMERETIETDIRFSTLETGFKSVLSMIPAFYMKGFEGLNAEGTFKVDGDIKGTYNAADSVLPDANIHFEVNNGIIDYPDLPGSVTDIRVRLSAGFRGNDIDKSELNLSVFHFSIAGNPFDLVLSVKTPVSDPEVAGKINGKIDLEALSAAVPMNVNNLKGIVELGVQWEGRLSMITDQRYDEFMADGMLSINNFSFVTDSLPPMNISEALLKFSPKEAEIINFNLLIAGSDIKLTGALSNYLPFVYRGETITGELGLTSSLIDLDEITSFLPAGEEEVESKDTLEVDPIIIPDNIDFTFMSRIREFRFMPMEASDIRGKIIVRNGIVTIEDTGLNTLGGSVNLFAQYSPGDSTGPLVDASVEIFDIGIQPVFETFNTVKKLAPVAEGMSGDVSVWFTFSSRMGSGMMPKTETISGTGRLKSDEITLVSSPIFTKFSEVLKLGSDFSNTFKDVDVNFSVSNGRVYVKPFNTKLGVMNANIGGDHGLDQTINYLIKTEMPSAYLPGSMQTLISGMAAQAALLGIKYTQPEVIRINATVTGTVKDPKIAPSLGNSGASSTVKEAAREVVEETVEKVVEEVRDRVSDEARVQADKILKEADDKAQLVRKEAADAAKMIRDEADANAQKLIDEAASKGAIAKIAANKAADSLKNEAEKRAVQLETEADRQATSIMEEARRKADELIGK